MVARTLYLVQPGEYHYIEPMMSTDMGRDVGLTRRGIRQARLLAERLVPLPVTAIIHSQQIRAIETAQILSETIAGVPLHHTELLLDYCPWMQYPPPPRRKRQPPPPEPELIATHNDAAVRAYARHFRTARKEDKHEVVICSGNLIRYFLAQVMGAVPEVLLTSLEICNCSITEVRIAPNGHRQIIGVNDVGFLPYELVTCAGPKMQTVGAVVARDG